MHRLQNTNFWSNVNLTQKSFVPLRCNKDCQSYTAGNINKHLPWDAFRGAVKRSFIPEALSRQIGGAIGEQLVAMKFGVAPEYTEEEFAVESFRAVFQPSKDLLVKWRGDAKPSVQTWKHMYAELDPKTFAKCLKVAKRELPDAERARYR